MSEAPSFAKVTGYGLGYWLRIASTVVIMVGTGLALLGLVRDAKVDRAEARAGTA